MEQPSESAADVGVGFSNETLVIVSITGFCALFATLYLLRAQTTETAVDDDEDENSPNGYEQRLVRSDPTTLSRAQRRARAHLLMKEQRRAATTRSGPGNEQNTVQVASRKDRQKAAKATELAERRVAEEESRRRQKMAEEMVARKREQKAAQSETERKQRELESLEQTKAQQLAWDTFLSNEDESLSVVDWLSSLEGKSQVVHLTSLASRFRTTIEKVEDRIKELTKEDRVAGIFDKHDRFVFLSDSDISKVTEQIQDAGHVSAKEVGRMCAEAVTRTV